jgi:hypothetical protein
VRAFGAGASEKTAADDVLKTDSVAVREEFVALAIWSPVIWLRRCCTVGRDGILRGIGNPA